MNVVDALLDVRKKKIEVFCTERLENGTSPYMLIEELTSGLREIGRGYKEIYFDACLLYTSPSPRDRTRSRMPSSA